MSELVLPKVDESIILNRNKIVSKLKKITHKVKHRSQFYVVDFE